MGGSILRTPSQIKNEAPLTQRAKETVRMGRGEVLDILSGADDRLLLIVGPCSIHDEEVTMEYARRIERLRKKYSAALCIVMRTYFEKPRTTVGWTGLLNDPYLDGTFDIDKGRTLARKILMRINGLGVPSATEILNTRTPAFIGDLISWGAIGARTTEDPDRRHMVSGLSFPVGFKNDRSGSVASAVDAIRTARERHVFVGIDKKSGRECAFWTKGNPDTHIVLRGGTQPNYDGDAINEACALLAEHDLPERVVVDCSHDNTKGEDGKKDHRRQSDVFRDVLSQSVSDSRIRGIMLESNLADGSQKLEAGQLAHGVSVTDPCIGWEETEELIAAAASLWQREIHLRSRLLLDYR